MSTRPAAKRVYNAHTHTIHVKLVHNIQQIVEKSVPNKNGNVTVTIGVRALQ